MRHFLRITWIVLFIFPASSFAARQRVAVAKEQAEKALLIELTGKDQGQMNETELYSELVSAYQAGDPIGFSSRYQAFMERFPRSSMADNAVYLAGRRALDQKRYAEALKRFNELMTKYPRSNRVVAASFAKAMTFKQMNLTEQARNAMKDVIRRYPGSPESFRASSEMRLLVR